MILGTLPYAVRVGSSDPSKIPRIIIQAAGGRLWRMRIPDGATLDTVMVDEWRAASGAERAEFIEREARKGHVSFVCLSCGYPTEHGVATCEACQCT